jgi:hypothetical protein
MDRSANERLNLGAFQENPSIRIERDFGEPISALRHTDLTPAQKLLRMCAELRSLCNLVFGHFLSSFLNVLFARSRGIQIQLKNTPLIVRAQPVNKFLMRAIHSGISFSEIFLTGKLIPLTASQ